MTFSTRSACPRSAPHLSRRSQHAPDDILLSVTEEALGIMAGLFWDLAMPRAV
jgi:hypothetical protein